MGRQHPSWRYLAQSGLALSVLVGLPALAQAAAPAQVTFTKDVAPILQRSCENCHHKGGMGPMSLSTYEEVRPWARAIKARTASREMPPWFIEKNVGIQKFKDDPSLSDEEIATIEKWVDSGSPRGNPADMPPARQYADGIGWTIGEPDIVVSSPVVTVKAVGPDYHREIGPSPTKLTEDRYIAAVQVKETRLDAGFQNAANRPDGMNYFTLHHAGIRTLDFDESGGGGAGDFYLIYELGQNATFYPRDTGVLLRAGSELTYTVHIHSVGREMPVRVDVGFKLHPKGFKPKYFQSGYYLGGAGGGISGDLVIPANRDNVRYEYQYQLKQPVLMTTFEPHLHMSGKRMCVEAIYPDGGHREILNCSGYNHNWVKVYMYEDDVAPLLPRGTIVKVMAWYDNTAANKRNIEPRNWKVWGNRSIDDMCTFLPKMTILTDEQYKEILTARQAKNAQADSGQQ